jgi:hypothetical protein
MKVEDLDFYAFDPHEDKSLMPDGPEACLRIVRATAHDMCEGQIPGEPRLRLGLLFSVMAKLAIECERAVMAAKKEAPRSAHEMIDNKANHCMASLVAAAAMWAEVAEEDSNALADFGD